MASLKKHPALLERTLHAMRVKVSKPSGSGYAVHWTALIAREHGFYESEGLDVTIVELDQAAGTEALLSGAVPIMRRGPDETIALVDRGEPVTLVAGLIQRPPIALYATPAVATVADLRGRTLAGISARFGSSLNVRILLEDEGLTRDDYTIVHAGGSYARFAAMQAGRADAAVLSPPTDRHAAQAGFRLLASLPERYPAFLFSAIQVQRPFAETNADALVRLLRAELRAQRVLADPSQGPACTAMLAASDALSLDDATSTYESMVVRDRVFSGGAAIAGPALQHLVDALIRFGEVRPGLRAEACYDARYLDAAR